MRVPTLLPFALLAAACAASPADAPTSPPPAPAEAILVPAPVAPPSSTDPATAAFLDRAVAERLDLDLAPAGEDRRGLLWDTFANRPYEQQFLELTTEDWFRKSVLFRARLLERAAANGLDAAALGRAIDTLGVGAADPLATVPVGAFAARDGADDVWIVVAKWETAGRIADPTTGAEEWLSLGHIWVVAVRTSDGTTVASVRCQ